MLRLSTVVEFFLLSSVMSQVQLDARNSSTQRHYLERYRHVDLSGACRYYGVRKTGTKAELVDRLLDFLSTCSESDKQRLPEALKFNPSTPNDFPLADLRAIRVIQPTSSRGPVSRQETTSISVDEKTMIACIDPFFPLSILEDPFLYCSIAKHGSVTFTLDLPDLKQWRRQGISLWLRGWCKTSTERQVWPKELRVMVNMATVQRIDEPKRLKKRRDEPIDLTVFLHTGRNQVQLSITEPNPQNFVLAIVACTGLTDKGLSSKVPTSPIGASKERTLRILNVKSDIIADDMSGHRLIDLRCPISLDRIITPAHGVDCEHVRCFDLDSYIAVNRTTSNINLRWKCPVCYKVVFPDKLVVDSFFQSILATAAADVTEVRINIVTGEYESQTPTAEPMDDDEEMKGESTAPVENGPMTEPVVMVLDDSSDSDNVYTPYVPKTPPNLAEIFQFSSIKTSTEPSPQEEEAARSDTEVIELD